MPTEFGKALKKNLFSNAFDSILSVITAALLIALFYSFVRWAIVEADWSVITKNIRYLMVGPLPTTDSWRAWVATFVFALATGLSIGAITKARRVKPIAVGLAISVAIGLALWVAGSFGPLLTVAVCIAAGCGWLISVRIVPGRALLSAGWVITTIILWELLVPDPDKAVGGLLLGVLITLIASVFSFPIGVLLALGRTSRLPGVRTTCVVYIELIRSLPLISVLYWAWMVVPLILPGDYRISDLVRGAIGFTFFYAAFVAEYIRGGLQGIPQGQWNAAHSLGLNTFSTIYYIVLPQAIRSVLPGLVGNVLDIFNNVPLLFIIGLTEFVRAGQVVLTNPQYSAQMYEMYVFMFLVYLVIATVLSWSSRVVEKNLNQTR